MAIASGVQKDRKMKYAQIKEITQKLRNGTTPSEVKLWKYLRRKQLDGRRFLRQHAIIYESIGDEHFFYVPDFYCSKENLAVELDGEIHFYQKEKDNNRDEILNDLGIRVLRFQNEELDDLENVLNRIRKEFGD